MSRVPNLVLVMCNTLDKVWDSWHWDSVPKTVETLSIGHANLVKTLLLLTLDMFISGFWIWVLARLLLILIYVAQPRLWLSFESQLRQIGEPVSNPCHVYPGMSRLSSSSAESLKPVLGRPYFKIILNQTVFFEQNWNWNVTIFEFITY